MERALILGCAGAGKSALALKMAAVTSLPVIHLDRHYWRPGWVEPEKATWNREVAALVAQPRWLMDGNYSGTLPMRLAAADTVIYLDFPTWICLSRVLRRTARWFGRTRGEDITPGCPERFDWAFLNYVRCFRRDHRPRVLSALESFSGRSIILHRPRDVRRFVRELAPA